VRIRQHVNPLNSFFFTIPIAPLDLPAGVPVEVELGSAEAFFLMDRAVEDPGRVYVGVEIRRDRVTEANEEAARRGIGSRVRSVFANMSVDLPRLFPSGGVSRFFINFPDPYFKRAQHKRRVVSQGLVEELHRSLAPGGEVYVATDIFELALDAMASLEAEPPARFENLVHPWTFLRQSPFSSRSRRELQCEGEDVRIWRLGYRKI
jgi:tRNA (guanine-N7-)-methyltransferase